MPTLTLLTLWYAAGVSAGAGFAIAPVATSGMVTLATAALLIIRDRDIAPQISLGNGIGFSVLGVLLATLALQQRGLDCRHRLVDGKTVTVVGALQQASAHTAWLQLRAVDDRPCGGSIRLLLGPKAKSARVQKGGRSGKTPPVQPGSVVRVTGEWWAQHDRNELALPGGVLLVETSMRTGSTDAVARVRGRTAERITELFGRQAPLAQALLIAQRDDIDPQVKQDFAASGLAHLLAISGTHVALVAAGIALIASIARFPPLLTGILAAAGSIAYVLFLGAPYPAVRAVIQIVLVLLARTLQRPAHPFGLLAAAGFGILIFDPLALHDAGDQLSFGGLIGIMLWRRPLIERQPASLPIALRDAIATSTAAALATTPIAAFHFGQLSLIAVPANLAALPLVSLAVPAAALALGLSTVSPALASFMAGGAQLLLARLENTAAIAAAVPGGHSYVTRTTVIAMLAGGAVAFLLSRQLWFFRPRARRVVALSGAVVIVIAFPAFQARPDAIEIHAIDVGQGDAIAVRTARGRWLLVDAGPRSDRYDAGASRVVPFLLRHGARKLEVLVLTHPHLDHVGGAAAVARVLDPEIMLDPDSGRSVRAAVRELDGATRERSQWLPARPGTRLVLDGLTLEVLYPDAGALDAVEDANNVSVVVRIGYGQFSALFTGDAYVSIEEALIPRHGARLDVDLLKVGHHGSSTSTGDAWLEATTPRIALISVGRGNRYGHPAPGVLNRLEQSGVRVFRTDRSGNVSLRAFGDGRIQVIDP